MDTLHAGPDPHPQHEFHLQMFISLVSSGPASTLVKGMNLTMPSIGKAAFKMFAFAISFRPNNNPVRKAGWCRYCPCAHAKKLMHKEVTLPAVVKGKPGPGLRVSLPGKPDCIALQDCFS